MRLPSTEHTSRPWRIHGIAPDFRLEDVWALATPGGPDDLPRLVGQFASDARQYNGAVRTLFTIRTTLGKLFGWDRPHTGIGARVQTLRDRLPADLRDAPAGQDLRTGRFNSLYLTGDEWAAEIANRTVHAVVHLGWVPDGAGAYRGQLAVLVKPNGLLGKTYMAAIRPFRHLVVYPSLIRLITDSWRTGTDDRGAAR